MQALGRLRQMPRYIPGFLVLFLVSGAADLVYHTTGLVIGARWLVDALGGSDETAFNVLLVETALHVLVAIGLIAFVISAFAYRLAEDEKRQREIERAQR